MRPSPGEVTPRVRGRPERAATPLAHALYTPLSLPPHLPTPGRSFGHGGNRPSSTPRASTGAFRRGGQFSTRANLGHASNTKGPLRRKTCTQKTAMTPVAATIRLRRSSPRSRGPPSQSESYVWDKALICNLQFAIRTSKARALGSPSGSLEHRFFFFLILLRGNRQIPGLATGAVGHSLFYSRR